MRSRRLLAPSLRSVMALCVFAGPAFALVFVASLLQSSSVAQLPLLLLGVAMGIGAADLLSGLVHWACDTWGDESTPVVGDGLIRSFREHHQLPNAMCDHDCIEVNGQAALPVTVAFCGLLSLDLPESAPLLESFCASFLAFAGLTNQFHQWAHRETRPRWVSRLQRSGLILSPERHAIHHSGCHDRSYCVSTGWLNPLLDSLDIWRRLERVLAGRTGAVR